VSRLLDVATYGFNSAPISLDDVQKSTSFTGERSSTLQSFWCWGNYIFGSASQQLVCRFACLPNQADRPDGAMLKDNLATWCCQIT